MASINNLGAYSQRETCPGCCGQRVQRRNDGILVRCPVCNGTGYIETYESYPWYPTYPWVTYTGISDYYVTCST